MDDVFDKVLFIGPALDHKGGISSVLKSYSLTMPRFRFIASNSEHGTVPGAFNLLALMLRLPVERLRGRRLLHIHGAMGKSWIRKTLIMRWGRLLGFKTIFHCHAGSAKDYFEKKGVDRISRILKKYDGIITLSEYWKHYFDSTFGREDRTWIINNIVIPPRHASPAPESDAAPESGIADALPVGKFNFLFLGALYDRKGIFDLLRAMTRPGLENVTLTVGGIGEVERFKAEVKALGLADRVEYVGWVVGEEKDRLLEQCDALILPSYIEGLPICILEAMANGKGVISTPVGGIPEIITDGENGFLVTPGDVSGLASAMRAYVDDPGLSRRHGMNSIARVAPYLPDAIISRLREIYTTVL